MLAFVAACGGGGGAPPAPEEAPVPSPPADAIVVDTDAGAAQIHVQVWPARPTLGDSIWLRLEVTAKPGVAVELPFDQAALGRFQVLRYVPEDARTDDGGAQRVDTYELAAPMSGRHRIPPLRVVVNDQRAGGGTQDVLTDEIPLDVGTVLAARTDRELSAAKGAMATEVGGGVWWTLIVVIAGASIVAGLVVLWFVLRARAVERGRIDAWDVAMQRLAELERAGAPAADAADAWFVTLSSIVRAYVEDRYRLRAPELTTEEFLLEARRIPGLTATHQGALGSFLERCDRVKFAGWRPETAESLEVLHAARAFVEETRPRQDAAVALVPAEAAS